MIFHILYISEATDQFKGSSDLEDILNKSKTNNKKKDLTGILIKNGKYFIQLLEGKKEVVSSTLSKISSDTRHTKVRVLMDYTDNSRIFPNWDMGLVQETDHTMELNELIPLLHTDILKLESTKDKIVSILKRFNKLS